MCDLTRTRVETPPTGDGRGVPIDVYLERLLQDEEPEIAHTEALLQDAVGSGDPIELTEEEWGRIEREAVADVESRSRQRA